MAIKIDGQDLLKRYINGQEIVRVYKNGGEIRPNTVPPTPPVFDNYLCFTANTSGSTVRLTRYGSPASVNLEISYDKSTWTSYNIRDTITLSSAGDKVYFRNTSTTTTDFSYSGINYYYFQLTGSIAGSGDATTLICKEGTTSLGNATFISLFKNCSSLTASPELPATTLVDNCYAGMFANCTALTTAPNLPATTIKANCYESMFAGCTSLTTAPSLPSSRMKTACYSLMFQGCTSLTTAPSLLATNLADQCYGDMFYGCTSLTTISSLPATRLYDNCYGGMFEGCTSLAMLPSLAAATLKSSCYMGMFRGCTNIKLSTQQDSTYTNAYTIPTSGTGSTATYALTDMFANTGGTFTGTPSINTTYYTSNTIV